MKKRILSLILAALMCLTLLPVTALADAQPLNHIGCSLSGMTLDLINHEDYGGDLRYTYQCTFMLSEMVYQLGSPALLAYWYGTEEENQDFPLSDGYGHTLTVTGKWGWQKVEDGQTDVTIPVLLDINAADYAAAPAGTYTGTIVLDAMILGTRASDNEYCYYLEESATATVKLVIPGYDVTVSSPAGCTITTDQTNQIAEGKTVHVTYSLDEGYYLSSLRAAAADGSAVALNADGSFTMPASNVTVTGTTIPPHTVSTMHSFQGIQAGTIIVDKTSPVRYGDTVSCSMDFSSLENPDYYSVESWLVKNLQTGQIVETNADNGGCSFTMPAFDVTVFATVRYEDPNQGTGVVDPGIDPGIAPVTGKSVVLYRNDGTTTNPLYITISTEGGTEGDFVKLPTYPPFEHENWIFLGWDTQSYTGVIEYRNGDEVDLTMLPQGGSLPLYAVWEYPTEYTFAEIAPIAVEYGAESAEVTFDLTALELGLIEGTPVHAIQLTNASAFFDFAEDLEFTETGSQTAVIEFRNNFWYRLSPGEQDVSLTIRVKERYGDHFTWKDALSVPVQVIVPEKYAVTVDDEITGGTITPYYTASSYAGGETCTLTVTPASRYVLDEGSVAAVWTDGNGATQRVEATRLTTTKYAFPMPAYPVTVTASFSPLVSAGQTQTYTVTAEASPAAGGTVTGGGTYNENATVTLTAAPNIGWAFVNWTENGEVVSTDAEYSFTVAEDSSLVANFVPYTVTLDPGDGQGEPITYSAADQATITHPDYWGDLYNCEFYIEDNGSLAFYLEDEYCPASFLRPADAAPGTVFYCWEEAGYVELSATQTTITAEWEVDWDRIPDASFVLAPDAITLDSPGFTDVEFTAEELVLGKYLNGYDHAEASYLGVTFWTETLTDGDGHEIDCRVFYADHTPGGFGTSIRLAAQGQTETLGLYIDPADYAAAEAGVYTGSLQGNWFWDSTGWSANGPVTDIPLTLTVEHTPQDSYTITAAAEPAEGGTVTGAGTYDAGAAVTLAAVPNEGWAFIEWTAEGVAQTGGAALTFPAVVDRAYTAVFREAPPLAIGDNAITVTSSYAPYTFTPAVSGTYTFRSVGTVDTLGKLVLVETLADDDDSGEGRNFEFSCELTAGTTYYLYVSCYGSGGETVVQIEAPSVYALSGDYVLFFPEDGYDPITEAQEGETVIVSSDFDAIPAGMYFTGEYESDDVTVEVNEVGDGTFTMIAAPVTVSAVLAEQEDYPVTLEGETPAELPGDILESLTGADCAVYDDALEAWTLDVNGDGEGDVLIDFENSAAVRLAGADAITESATVQLEAGGYARYNSVTFTFPAPQPEGPVITGQPESWFGQPGEYPEITVTAEGEGELSYQWYWRNCGEETWHVSSEKDDCYDSYPLTITRNGREVYCVVTDSTGSSVSASAFMYFDIPDDWTEPTVTAQPQDWAGAYGETPDTICLEAEGMSELTYKWYYSDNGGEKWSASSDKDAAYDSYPLTKARDGRQLYCVVTDKYGFTVQSDTVTMKQYIPEGYEGPVIVEQPENWRGVMGDMPQVAIEAEGEELTYHWYYKDAGKTKFSLSAETDDCYDSYPLSVARAGRELYCVVTDKYGLTATSETVTMDFDVPDGWTGPSVTAQPESWTGELGDYPDITFTVEGEGVTYQWYWRNAGLTKWYTSSDKDNCYDSYPLTEVRNGREVYCVATDKYGCQVTSEIATMSLAG